MKQILIDCPNEFTNGQNPAALAKIAQEAFLVRLYQLGHISSGRAAEALHQSRREFLDLLGEYGVSLFDEEIDVEAEARRGRPSR